MPFGSMKPRATQKMDKNGIAVVGQSLFQNSAVCFEVTLDSE